MSFSISEQEQLRNFHLLKFQIVVSHSFASKRTSKISFLCNIHLLLLSWMSNFFSLFKEECNKNLKYRKKTCEFHFITFPRVFQSSIRILSHITNVVEGVWMYRICETHLTLSFSRFSDIKMTTTRNIKRNGKRNSGEGRKKKFCGENVIKIANMLHNSTCIPPRTQSLWHYSTNLISFPFPSFNVVYTHSPNKENNTRWVELIWNLFDKHKESGKNITWMEGRN